MRLVHEQGRSWQPRVSTRTPSMVSELPTGERTDSPKEFASSHRPVQRNADGFARRIAREQGPHQGNTFSALFDRPAENQSFVARLNATGKGKKVPTAIEEKKVEEVKSEELEELDRALALFYKQLDVVAKKQRDIHQNLQTIPGLVDFINQYFFENEADTKALFTNFYKLNAFELNFESKVYEILVDAIAEKVPADDFYSAVLEPILNDHIYRDFSNDRYDEHGINRLPASLISELVNYAIDDLPETLLEKTYSIELKRDVPKAFYLLSKLSDRNSFREYPNSAAERLLHFLETKCTDDLPELLALKEKILID